MNIADQIEMIARDTTDRLAQISREFSATQQQVADQAATGRIERHDSAQRLRCDLAREAEMSDVGTPRILLPADMARVSPHQG